eukprot:gene5899-6827_t
MPCVGLAIALINAIEIKQLEVEVLKRSLIDNFSRKIDYLRLSVTDRCDFRCVYCMTDDMKFLPRQQVMTFEEHYQVAASFVALGTRKIRITGGEPLIRPGVVGFCKRLAKLPGLHELCMTTNGSQLKKLAAPLHESGVKRLNISLDSLRAERFSALTRYGDLKNVLVGIDAARHAGFQRTKINCVVLKGRNDQEINDMVSFAISQGLDISFIEEMPLGLISEHSRTETFYSSAQVRERIAERYTLIQSNESTQGPSYYWRLAEAPHIRVGFISPHSDNFCLSCNRVRITSDGKLLLCLGNDDSVDLKRVLRNYSDDSQQLEQSIIDAMKIKPYRHHFAPDDHAQLVRLMNITGG